MITSLHKHHNTLPNRILSGFVAFSFIFSLILPPGYAQLLPQALLNLPAPGTMVTPTAGFIPPRLIGVTIHADNPLKFDFIVNTGDADLAPETLKEESRRLIKYFLASLTVPEDELWVNLSPYENDRMVPQGLGQTEMGRDMLAQDYLLKQLTASLIYPEKELGKKFWDRVYQKIRDEYGTIRPPKAGETSSNSQGEFDWAEIPVNTFNKVWIVPEQAVVYESKDTAFVAKSRLRVMLEQDYVAMQHNLAETPAPLSALGGQQGLEEDYEAMNSNVTENNISTSIIREIIIPAIEKEVNEGENFAKLRQMYHSLVLAAWYKLKLKDGLLGQVYVDQNKTKGIETQDKQVNQKIYDQYVESFKKGVYNYIKEDYDPATNDVIPRKYFSGGIGFNASPEKEGVSGGFQGILAMVAAGLIVGGTMGQSVEAQEFFRNIKETGKNNRIEVVLGENPKEPAELILAALEPSDFDKGQGARVKEQGVASDEGRATSDESASSPVAVFGDALKASYASKVTDEYVKPVVLTDAGGNPVGAVKKGDAWISLNFRRDRTTQLTEALLAGENFKPFPAENLDLMVVEMKEDENGLIPQEQLVMAPVYIPKTIGEYFSQIGLKQFRTAETEKFRHVTRFFNGAYSTKPFAGEDRLLVPSPKDVATYDQKPEMSAYQVTAGLIEKLQANEHDFYLINYANPDMVGHTGNLEATVQAIGHVDKNLQQLLSVAQAQGLNILVTADHGNADEMLDKEGKPQTKHSLNPVPFIFVPSRNARLTGTPALLPGGGLADVAPTLLYTMGLEQPAEMTGRNLLGGYAFDKGQKTLLIVLDGFAINPNRKDPGDAIRLAGERGLTPTLDRLFRENLNTLLDASGEAVGLPKGQMGSSETGHMIMGAGRVIKDQPLVKINEMIAKDHNDTESFFKNSALLKAMHYARDNRKALHIEGLLSDGGVHSMNTHWYALLEMAKAEGVSEVYLHPVLDGRDVGPQTAGRYLEELQQRSDEIGVGQIVTMMGRFYAMDRDYKWDRTKIAYDAYVHGQGERVEAASPLGEGDLEEIKRLFREQILAWHAEDVKELKSLETFSWEGSKTYFTMDSEAAAMGKRFSKLEEIFEEKQNRRPTNQELEDLLSALSKEEGEEGEAAGLFLTSAVMNGFIDGASVKFIKRLFKGPASSPVIDKDSAIAMLNELEKEDSIGDLITMDEGRIQGVIVWRKSSNEPFQSFPMNPDHSLNLTGFGPYEVVQQIANALDLEVLIGEFMASMTDIWLHKIALRGKPGRIFGKRESLEKTRKRVKEFLLDQVARAPSPLQTLPTDRWIPDENSAKTGRELTTKLLKVTREITLVWGMSSRDVFVVNEIHLRESPRVIFTAISEFERKMPDEDISQATGEALIRWLYQRGVLAYMEGSEVKPASSPLERERPVSSPLGQEIRLKLRDDGYVSLGTDSQGIKWANQSLDLSNPSVQENILQLFRLMGLESSWKGQQISLIVGEKTVGDQKVFTVPAMAVDNGQNIKFIQFSSRPFDYDYYMGLISTRLMRHVFFDGDIFPVPAQVKFDAPPSGGVDFVIQPLESASSPVTMRPQHLLKNLERLVQIPRKVYSLFSHGPDNAGYPPGAPSRSSNRFMKSVAVTTLLTCSGCAIPFSRPINPSHYEEVGEDILDLSGTLKDAGIEVYGDGILREGEDSKGRYYRLINAGGPKTFAAAKILFASETDFSKAEYLSLYGETSEGMRKIGIQLIFNEGETVDGEYDPERYTFYSDIVWAYGMSDHLSLKDFGLDPTTLERIKGVVIHFGDIIPKEMQFIYVMPIPFVLHYYKKIEKLGNPQGGSIYLRGLELIPNEGAAVPIPLMNITKKETTSSPVMADVKRKVDAIVTGQMPRMLEQMNEIYGKAKEGASQLADNKFARIGFDGSNNRLGWMPVHLKEILEAGRLEKVLADAKKIRERYKYVIFSGMGGSGLSVQAVKSTFGEPEGLKIFSLRTTDPSVIAGMLKQIAGEEESLQSALEKTLLIVSSKSGTTQETKSHQEYFEGLFARHQMDPREHLWLMTDPGSPMEQEVYQKGYPLRYIQLNGGKDIGGRFTSPATNIFLLPLALVAPEKVEEILQRALRMNEAEDIKEDIFVRLGAYLYVMASEFGKDKVTMLVPGVLKDVPMWSEQLFEESLGKDGKGVTIFYDEELNYDEDPHMSDLKPVEENDRVFVRVNVGDKKTEGSFTDQLKAKGYPVFDINLESIDDIGGLMLGFQRTVATIGYLWDIVFVDQPGVEGYKRQTREVLSRLGPGEKAGVPQEWKSGRVRYGKMDIYYQPLIEAGVMTREELEAEVQRLGTEISDAAAVYAAIINIARRKGRFEVAEIASYGHMTAQFRSLLDTVRLQTFTWPFRIPTKLAEGPDKNHSFQQNVAQGKDMFFSTYFMPLETVQPAALIYDDNPLRAQTIGTVKSLVEAGRKAVLITIDSSIRDLTEVDLVQMRNFFDEVHLHLASSSPVVGEEEKDRTESKGPFYISLFENIKKFKELIREYGNFLASRNKREYEGDLQEEEKQIRILLWQTFSIIKGSLRFDTRYILSMKEDELNSLNEQMHSVLEEFSDLFLKFSKFDRLDSVSISDETGVWLWDFYHLINNTYKRFNKLLVEVARHPLTNKKIKELIIKLYARGNDGRIYTIKSPEAAELFFNNENYNRYLKHYVVTSRIDRFDTKAVLEQILTRWGEERNYKGIALHIVAPEGGKSLFFHIPVPYGIEDWLMDVNSEEALRDQVVSFYEELNSQVSSPATIQDIKNIVYGVVSQKGFDYPYRIDIQENKPVFLPNKLGILPDDPDGIGDLVTLAIPRSFMTDALNFYIINGEFAAFHELRGRIRHYQKDKMALAEIKGIVNEFLDDFRIEFDSVVQEAVDKLVALTKDSQKDQKAVEASASEIIKGIDFYKEAGAILDLFNQRSDKGNYNIDVIAMFLIDTVDRLQNDYFGDESSASSPAINRGQGTGDGVQEITNDEIRDTNDEKVGGIDLNPALLDLQIKRDGKGVPLPLPLQPIENMHIEGFIPIIINVTPIANLPLLLGLADTQQDTEETIPAMKARELEEVSLLN